MLNELVSTDIPMSIIGLELMALKLKQNVQLCAFNMVKIIYIYKNVCVLITVLLKLVPNDPIKNKQVLVEIKPWCRAGNSPLTETMTA